MGRIAHLGGLYDARKNVFLTMSIFNEKVPNDAIDVLDNHFSDVQFSTSETYSEKFSHLEVNAELQVSVLAGLVTLSGSGKYLNDKTKSARTARSSLHYKIKTKQEQVNIFNKSLKDKIELKSLDVEAATHVVVGIQWGANTILTCEYQNVDENEKTLVEGKLSAKMEKISNSIKGGVEAAFNSNDIDNSHNFRFHMHGDVLPRAEDLPTTFEETLKLMKKVPSLIADANNGKGIPLMYSLVPIALVKKCMEFTSAVDTCIVSLKEQSLNSIVAFFEDRTCELQRVWDLHKYATSPSSFFKESDKDSIKKLKSDCELQVSKFRSDLASKLIKVRSGQAPETALDELMIDFQKEYNSSDMSSRLQKLESIKDTACALSKVPMRKVVQKPNNRVELKMRCIGQNCSMSSEHMWHCPKCKKIIEYSFDDKAFCCDCGMAPIEEYEFKCPDNNHGRNFESPNDMSYYDELISQLRPFKEVNILLLGETGVGKSTWINAFSNYMKFETLQDAEASDTFVSLIPSKFTLCDEESFNELEVCTGEDKNEFLNPGQSSTQGCKTHRFVVDDLSVNLIDTPGVADTRGDEQDKENFQNILETIARFDELHGICILLKPNEARMSLTFRYFIKELLTYLHRDASSNIIFCFTNSRSTLFRPGETMRTLKEVLKENVNIAITIAKPTVYCYDSEAYRFLAAAKNKPDPISFTEKERENFQASWDHSAKEAQRMMKHISQKQPHSVSSTLSLNRARDMVLKLCKPIAEVESNIVRNKNDIAIKKKLIEEGDENIAGLKKKAVFEISALEIVPLDYPRTVCTNISCKKIVQNEDGICSFNYVTVCHERCELTGVPCDTFGHEKLLNCVCISGNNCIHAGCGHSYKEHMHISFETKEVKKKMINEKITKMIETEADAQEIKQAKIKELDNFNAEFESEAKTIVEYSLKFAHFLKTSSITPYNDATVAYKKHLIKEEEDKMAAGQESEGRLIAMKESLRTYEKNIDILKIKMTEGAEISKAELANIEQMVEELCNLKHSGNFIKEALEAVKNAHSHSATQSNKSHKTNYSGKSFIATLPEYVQEKKEEGTNYSGKSFIATWTEYVQETMEKGKNWVKKKLLGKSQEAENRKTQEAEEERKGKEAEEETKGKEAAERKRQSIQRIENGEQLGEYEIAVAAATANRKILVVDVQ